MLDGNDLNNLAIPNLLTRNTEILKCLRLAGSCNLLQGDKLAKTRPFYDILNERLLMYFPYDQNLAVDKPMIPYYGLHSAEQSL